MFPPLNYLQPTHVFLEYDKEEGIKDYGTEDATLEDHQNSSPSSNKLDRVSTEPNAMEKGAQNVFTLYFYLKLYFRKLYLQEIFHSNISIQIIKISFLDLLTPGGVADDDDVEDVITTSDLVSPFFVACLKSIVEGSVQCRLSQEISHISDDPILVMGRCLPHIMPHVLLSKREVRYRVPDKQKS